MKKMFVYLIVGFILAFGIQANAYALVLFHEDFNNVGNTTFGNWPSAPSIALGADNNWAIGRFETTEGNIYKDVGFENTTPATNASGKFRDDAGILVKISTLGHQNILLDFDWRVTGEPTDLAGDNLIMGYYVGSITGFNDVPGREFVSTPPTWGSWTQMLSGNSTAWTHATFSLPDDQSEVWLAFWMNDAGNEYGRGNVDNINITGDVIPEPASMSLLGLGLLSGLARLRRKS